MAETVLKYNYNSDLKGYEIIGYESISDSGNLIIPEKYEGDSVVSIGESAFEYCTSLTSVTIPDSVISIDERAFYGCDAIDFKYVKPIPEGGNFPYGASSNSTRTFIGLTDMDFLGFTFDGLHSYLDLGVYRVISGDRYTEDLSPEKQDITADVPGGNG